MKYRIWMMILLVLGLAALTTVYVLNNSVPVLEPKGMIGIKERELLITASLLMLIVVIPVYGFLFYFSWKYRASNEKAKHTPDWEHNTLAEVCWWGVPFIIVVILALITWKSTHELNPFKPIENGTKPLEIQVVAMEWKWLFIYPEQGVAAVNYVQFPEKTPLNFELTADAPMNSFWIPQLGGMIYAMPAMRSKLHLIADETGEFDGRAAHINGKGFSGMVFKAKATTPEEFNRFVAEARRAPPLDYAALMEPSEYVPPKLYSLNNPDLFNQIVMKYHKPSEQ